MNVVTGDGVSTTKSLSSYPESDFAIAIYNPKVDSYARRNSHKKLSSSPCHDNNVLTKLAVLKDLALCPNNRDCTNHILEFLHNNNITNKILQ